MMVRMRALLCGFLSLLLAFGCAGSGSGSKTAEARADQDIVRYRLPLRGNSVSPREASLCYGECQSASSPGEYLDCLAECPGFEVTPGAPCGARDVPPQSACLVVRRVHETDEVAQGMVVVGVVAGFALIVTAASLCASSNSQCGYAYEYPPPK